MQEQCLPFTAASALGFHISSPIQFGLCHASVPTGCHPFRSLLDQPAAALHFHEGDAVAQAVLIPHDLRRQSLEVASEHARLSRNTRKALAEWLPAERRRSQHIQGSGTKPSGTNRVVSLAVDGDLRIRGYPNRHVNREWVQDLGAHAVRVCNRPRFDANQAVRGRRGWDPQP